MISLKSTSGNFWKASLVDGDGQSKSVGMKSKVIGLGEVLWDVLPEGKHLGGAPANFAYHAGQQGAESTVVSRIGNDDLGSEIRDEIQ